MNIQFTKMHGLGNDFVVIDATKEPLTLSPEQAAFIADRRFGIGCDQILLVEAPQSADTEFYYRIFNSDGSEVEQCGNGARCFARFVKDRGLTNNDVIDVGTAHGAIRLFIEDNGDVRVNMGAPILQPEEIPFTTDQAGPVYSIELPGGPLELGAVSMGNPHAVLLVEDVNTAPVEGLGPMVENHEAFPNRVNVGFMAVKAADHIDLRVFERGAGETLACGTGACAAVVSGRLRGILDEQVRVSLPGGELVVSWAGEGEPVWMTGPATRVFDGRIEL